MKKLLYLSILAVFSLIELPAQTCFTKNWTGNGLDQMNIYVTRATINGVNMQAGDEIGVFDGNACVGVGVLTAELGGAVFLSIIVSRDDPDTPARDGYTVGNPISFRQCNNGGTQIVTNVVANFTAGNGLFAIGGTAVAELSGTSECSNPPTVTLGSTSGSTCETTPVTVTGNQFGGSATSVTISTNGAGSVSPTSTGTSPFSFTYTPGVGDIGNTVTITVTTDNPLGSPCVAATASYIVAVNPLPAAAGTITGTATVCQGANSVAYSVPAIANATSYLWTYSGSGATITGTTNAVTVSFSASATSGNLTVQGVNTCGNGTVSANYAIAVNPLPAAAGTLTGTPTVCQGATSVAYNVPVIANATSYLWTYSGSGATITGTTNAVTVSFSTSATLGNLTVQGVNTCGNGTVSANYAIAVNPLPAAAGTITGTATVCQGANSVAYSVPAIANATSYLWTYSGSGATITGTTNAVTVSFSASATLGNLTVQGVNTCGNGTVSANYAIAVNPLPAAAGTITGTATVCQGANSVVYSVPAISNATSYLWTYSGTGATIVGTTNSVTINFATNATTGNLTVRGVNTCGNGTVSANYAITVNPLPAAAGTITGTATVCQGATSVAYNVPVIANATSYLWSYSGTGATIVGTTNSVTINFATNATTGNLTVRGVNACGNGTVSANYAITVNPLPAAAGTITGTATVCQGTNSVAYNVPVIANATSYLWTYSGSGATITGTTNAVTVSFSASATSGNLTVQGVNTCGNGTTSANYPITVNPLPAAAGTITGTPTVCQGATSVAYNVPVIANATSYLWTYSGSGATITGTTNAVTVSFSASATLGNLTVQGVNTCGNGTTSANYPITVNPLPAAAGTITGTATVCQGATTVAYSVPAIANATSYLWTYSGSGATITGTTNAVTVSFSASATSGNLTVRGVNTCGNGTTSANYPITVNPLPAAAGTITGTATVCQGANSVAYSVPAIANATSYLWTYSGSGATITGTTNAVTVSFSASATLGNLTVQGVNTCGNGTTSANYPITVNPLPAAAGTITGTATVCQGANSVAYSVPAIANATSYLWSYSGTGATIVGTTNSVTINFAANATTGNLTVRGVNTCGNGTVSANYAIAVNPLPAAAGTITGTATVCQGANSVAYSVPAIANATSYLWTYSGSGATITGTTNAVTVSFSTSATSGNLTVQGVNTCGNGTVSANYAIAVNPLPAAAGTITGTATVCQGATTVAYNVPAIANATSYLWTYSGSGATITGTTNAVTVSFSTSATSGNLTVQGVNTCGNGTVSANYAIAVNPLPAAAGTITGTPTVCQGATTVAYSVPAIANATSYLWTYSGSGATITGTTNAVTVSFSTSATSGNLTVQGVNTCGNGTVSANYAIAVNPLPAAAGTITGTATVCQGANSVAYSVPAIANATSYLWTYSGSGATITGTTNAVTVSFSTSATSGNLTVQGVNTCGNGTVSANYAIAVNPLPAAAGTITGTATVCQGATTVAYNVPAIANATSYLWTYSGTGATIVGTTNSVTINFAANATTGNLTVRGVNTCGNGTVSANYAIAVNPLPAAAGTITGTATVCQGANSVVYSVPAISNATSYLWTYSGTGATIVGTTNSVTINFATNATTGNLTVRGVNTCGNGTVSANYAITVNPLPAAAGTITGTATVCQGATSVAYNVPVIANATSYLWSYSGTGATIVGTTNSVTINFATNATTGNLTVRGVNACGNGTVSANYAITVNPLPAAAGTITGTATVCQGTNSVAYNVPVIANATSYLWTYSGTGATIVGTTNSVTINFAANATTGNLTVRGVNTCGNGTVSANYAITVNPLPAAAGTITGTPTVCQGATSVAYNVPVIANATSYLWSYSGTGANIVGTTNSVTINFATNATTGNLTVRGVNACGNGTISANYAITVNQLPTANAGAALAAICQGGTSATLGGSVGGSATGGIWSSSAGGTFTPDATTLDARWHPPLDYSGTATLTLTTNGGSCGIATDSKTQVVNPSATIVLTSGSSTQTLCQGLAITNIVYSIGGGGTGAWVTGLPAGVNGSYSGGLFTITGTPTVTGTYNYEVTTIGTCSQTSANGTITVNPNATITLTSGSSTQTVCQGSAVTNIVYTIGGGGTWAGVTGLPAGVSGSFSGGLFTISGAPTVAGTFPFTVTTTGTCTQASAGGTITAVAVAAPTVGIITQPICAVATGSVALSGLPSGNWTINPGAIIGSTTSRTVTGLTAGSYNFTVTNSIGCVSPPSSTVTVDPQPVTPTAPVIGTITQPTCNVSTGSVVVNGLPSSGNWTLTRSPGGNTTTGSGTSTTISNLTAATTYTFTVTNSDLCTSPSSNQALINAQPPTPTAPVIGPVVQPTCTVATGSITIEGLPSGSWILIQYPGGATTDGSGPSVTLSGIPPGTYNYSVTNSFLCTSSVSSNAVVNGQPPTPVAPTVGATTQPTCSVATGSVVLNNLPSGNWTITRSPGGSTYNGSSSSYTVTGLTAGNYTFTVTNSFGCISGSSANVVINTQPVTPTPPVTGAISHPTCTVPTGSVALSGLPSTGSWVLTRNPGGATYSGSGTTYTATGIPAGTHTFTVTNQPGCTSAASAGFTINAQPPTPAAPTHTVNCALGAGNAVVTVTNPTGAGYEYSLNGGAFQTSTLFTGVANGTYTITVRNSSSCTNTGSPFSISCGCANPPTLLLSSTAGSTCGTSPITVSGNTFGGATQVTITENAAGTVTPASSSVSPFSFTYTPGAGDIGNTVIITVTTNNPLGSPCSAATATYTLTVNAIPAAPAVGVITHPTCLLSTGSVAISGLPSGSWTLTRNPGGTTYSGSGSGTTVSGLAAGTYTFTVTTAAGCVSPSSANVVISSQPATPTAPTIGTITQPTCAISTGSVVLNGLPATGTWTVTRSPGGVTATGTGTTTTVPVIPAGAYTFTVSNQAGCVSPASASATIDPQPVTPSAPLVGTIAQPSCGVPTGSVFLSGLPATGNWVLTRYPGAITLNGSGSSITIAGLATGTYNYTVTNAAICTSGISSNVVINTALVVPGVPSVGTITPPTCDVATGSVALSNLPSGNWTLTRTPDGVTTNGSGTSVLITGLAAGTYTYRVTNADGCASGSTPNVVIITQPATPTPPIIGTVTQPTCAVSTGSVGFSGLPSIGTWTLTRIPGGETVTGTGTTRMVSGIPAGTYSFTVTNSVSCTSTMSTSVTINTQPVTPSAPVIGTITQPTCNVSTGSIQLTGLPASGEWTVTRSPGAVITTGFGPSVNISPLLAGSYSFTVRNADGCTSSSSASVTINAQPTTPSAPVLGTITQPTCTVGTASVVLSGLPSGTWTLTRYPGLATTTGSTTSTTITGLSPGSYNYTVTNSSTCTSTVSNTIFIDAQPPSPTTPLHSIDCSQGFGKAIITVTSPTAANYEYRLDGGDYQTSNIFNGVANGNHSITVRNLSGCITTGTTFSVNCGCVTPPTVTLSATSGSTCGTTAVTVSGNIFGGSATSVTISENGGGTVTPATGTASPFSFTYTPVAADAGKVVTITVTTNNPLGSPCTAATAIYTLTVNAIPAAPSVGTITQPTCTEATGSVILNNLPAAGEWTLTRSPGGTTITGTGTSTTVSGLATGTYTFTVTNANVCISASSANVVITAQPPTPTPPVVGTITQPTCALSTGSVALSGLPATGIWTITRSPGGIITTGTGTTRTITGLEAGSYTFTVRNASGCTSAASDQVVINEQPVTPTAPLIGTITQPSCDVATGSVIINGLPSSGEWTLIRYPGAITNNGTGTSTTVASLTNGTYNFAVMNESGCTSVVSANVLINVQPATPTAPIVGAITHPTFTVPTGSVALSGLPSTGTWTLTRQPDNVVVTGTGTTRTISGIEPGTYTFTVTNQAGCTSVVSASVVINAIPGAPTVIITNPAPVCSPATVDLTSPEITAGSSADLSFTYWTDEACTIPYETPEAATAGTYYIRGTTTAGYSTIRPVVVIVDVMPLADAGPDQVLEYLFRTTLSATPVTHGTGVWSRVSGSGIIVSESDPNTVVNELSLMNNEFRWTVTNGVCPPVSDVVSIFVNDLIIPTLITPNNDTRNDCFVLRGIENLGRTNLIIFDRRGAQVYSNDNYDNSWNGVDKSGNPLQDDTYFFTIRTENGRSFTGYIVIRR